MPCAPMKAVYSPHHRGHIPGDVTENGIARPSRDSAERVDALLRAASGAACEVLEAEDHGVGPITRVHSQQYIAFLATAFGDWRTMGLPGVVMPATFEVREESYRSDWSVIAKAGFHLRDQLTPIGEGTWTAAYWAAQTALTAAQLLIQGERHAYALCRPSGHHAGRSFGGGATYLNNAAIAAAALAGDGKHIAVLDFDVHHGNGTQEIFWASPNILFASVHRSQTDYYPHFTGYADEVGDGEARGSTLNIPLGSDAGDQQFNEAAHACVAAALNHRPAAIVVSLGFDALASDPAKGLQVTASGFTSLARLLGALEQPILLVQEGGYDLEALQDVAGVFLSTFLDARGVKPFDVFDPNDRLNLSRFLP